VRGVCELYEPLAEEKGLAIKIDASEPALIKATASCSAGIANLVDNALKYAAPGPDAPAEIVLAARQETERVLLTVADRGPASRRRRGRAVERFVRLPQNMSEPGSGLGLSLAAAVATLHGGELKLEDNAPGLRVVIALPRHVGG